MHPLTLAVLMPPVAVARYRCACRCAAPIGVFWIGGLGALATGVLGGLGFVAALGLAMTGLAILWAVLTVRGASPNGCAELTSRGVSHPLPWEQEPDPLAMVREAQGRD